MWDIKSMSKVNCTLKDFPSFAGWRVLVELLH